MGSVINKLLAVLVSSGVVTSVHAEARAIDVHGFLLGAAALRTTGERPVGGQGGDFVLGEGRLHLDLGGRTASGKGSFVVRGDLFLDEISSELDVDIREAHAVLSTGPMDVRLGRQIVTWGVGDLLFIDDVFPKDWNSFFSGRPAEYLKHGVDGFRMTYSSDTVGIDFLTIPVFTSDTLPSSKRFTVFDPFSALGNRVEEKPGTTIGNTELALRVFRRVGGADLSFYVYRGFSRSPAVRPDSFQTRFYPRLTVIGSSGQANLLSGVLSTEVAHYDFGAERAVDEPFIPNSQWRFLVGYQCQLWGDSTLGIQAYEEALTFRALPAVNPRPDRYRTVLTSRLTQLLRYQIWKLGLFAAYSPTDHDYFLRPEVSYKMIDSLNLSFGANLFGGTAHTTYFGQFDKSDNVFFNVRFDF